LHSIHNKLNTFSPSQGFISVSNTALQPVTYHKPDTGELFN